MWRFHSVLAALLLFVFTGCAARDADIRIGDEGPTESCDAARPCPAGRRCIDALCLPDNGTCQSDDDCLNDSYCACPPQVQAESCVCVPWGRKPRGDRDPSCAASAFAPGEFLAPTLKCQWPPSGPTVPLYKDVTSTPLVIDLDGDKQPEIVFVAGVLGVTHLVAISGKDCSVVFDKPHNFIGCQDLAAGDLDGDGRPEIVGFTGALTGGLAVFDGKGDKLAAVAAPLAQNCAVGFPPAIANVDGQGPPEIIAGAAVLRYSAAKLEVLWKDDKAPATDWGLISVVEDLDEDGLPEVITGNRVYDGATGKDETPSILRALRPGYPAIGDFDMDGHPDIVLVSSAMDNQEVSIIDFHRDRLLMPLTPATMGWGGAPTVADFDGDGRPEFATASARYYYVYSPDCVAQPRPAKCKGLESGVLWQSATQDESSGATGSSLFDFNGDRIAEVVYRDECWLRVYSGPDGRKLFAAPVSSGTGLELPVIADTDGDGHADIVVSSDSMQGDKCNLGPSRTELGQAHGPPTFGVKVFKDPRDRWMPSRGIWNQHSYHITNVNDDGTIPPRESPNFKRYNNYRQNVQGAAAGNQPAGDATGAIVFGPDAGDCVTEHRLYGAICNRGAAPLPAGVYGSFYAADPRQGGLTPVCTGQSRVAVAPGRCEVVSCIWHNPPSGPRDLWFRANDDGKGARPEAECKGGNNLAHLGGAGCMSGPG